jgi:hypothetical protein
MISDSRFRTDCGSCVEDLLFLWRRDSVAIRATQFRKLLVLSLDLENCELHSSLRRRRGDSALCFTGGELTGSNARKGFALRGELSESLAGELGCITSRFSVPSDDELRLSERATLWLLTRRMNCALL